MRRKHLPFTKTESKRSHNNGKNMLEFGFFVNMRLSRTMPVKPLLQTALSLPPLLLSRVKLCRLLHKFGVVEVFFCFHLFARLALDSRD